MLQGPSEEPLATHALGGNGHHGLLASLLSSCDVRNICIAVQCFCTFKVLSHKLPMELGPEGGGCVSATFGGHSMKASLPSLGLLEHVLTH